jgi:hypothetical protein
LHYVFTYHASCPKNSNLHLQCFSEIIHSAKQEKIKKHP